MRHLKLKTMLIFTVLLIGSIAVGSEQQIADARRDLSLSQVKTLNRVIAKACIKHDIPCDIFTAMLIHESRLRVSAINTKTHDYGIGQINIKTIKRLKLDQFRLTYDVEYSVDAAAKVLSYFHKHYSYEAMWYCRFNIGTRKMTSTAVKLCSNYSIKVNMYMIVGQSD